MPRSVTDIEILVNNITVFINKDILLGSLNDTENNICFDCELWNRGFSTIDPISKTFVSLLSDIEVFLSKIISNQQLNNFGFKSQIDRLFSMIRDLKNKVLAIVCIDVCNDSTNIISHLLYTLIQTLLVLVVILENINALLSYIDPCCCSPIVFDLLMGKLINSITDVQLLLKDWYSIVMTFLHYSTMSTKPYIASYVPKQPIMPPSPSSPMSHACVPCPPTPCQPKPSPNNCTTYPY